jgi:subtilisin family serine protease
MPGQPVYYVSDPLRRDPVALVREIDDDYDGDVSFERDQTLRIPETRVVTNQVGGLTELERALQNATYSSYYGAQVHAAFPNQLAARIVRSHSNRLMHGIGTGTVAVVDTGVDPNHPFLRPVLVPGIDLLTPNGTANELTGLPTALLLALNPTTTPLLGRRLLRSNPTTTPLLEQATGDYFQTNSIPRALGHGTMVAGAVRLVAPGARIMPIRAFNSAGTGTLWNTLRAIYLAHLRGARILNLSLNTYTYSRELEVACEFVSANGVIVVASAGNSGRTDVPSYPASFGVVTGVASTTASDVRSLFSNVGEAVVEVGAPGEAMLLPFPGERWAGGWGTSYAAPLVAGLAAHILQSKPDATYSDLQSALGHSRPLLDPNIGLGRLDVYNSVSAMR